MTLIVSTGFAQNAPDWDFITGGTGNEYCWNVAEALDGGFVMAGWEDWEGGNALLLKTSNGGTLLWSQSYGGTLSDKILSVESTTDGGFILLGSTLSYASGNNREIWLIKTDAVGDEVWSYTFGAGSGQSVQQTSDGGYIIAGSSLIKTDKQGLEIWRVRNTNYGSVTQTNDGGYALLSYFIGEYITLDKRFADGSLDWTHNFGGSGNNFGETVQQTADGGYIISATTSSYGAGLLDAWIIKTDADGIQEWNQTYGGVFHDEAHDVKQTVDGGYIFTGLTQKEVIYNNDIWVVKIDAQGTMQWDYSYDYLYDSYTFSVMQTSDNGYLVGGIKTNDNDDKDMWMVHFPSDNLTSWFTATPTSITEGETVNFYDGSLGTAVDWLWSFDVGTGTPITSTEQNPSVTYNVNGTFNATLTINYGASSLTRTGYIEVGQSTSVEYCTSFGDDSSLEWIETFNFGGTINNSGSDGGYGDYTTPPISIESGNTYTLTLTPDFSSRARKEYWRVWIDYNVDGDFLDDGEEVFAANAKKGDVSGSINIPSGLNGPIMMRVSMKYNAAPTSCENFPYGEVEDYTLLFAPPIPQPPVADFSADVTYISTGTTVNFNDLTINDPTEWDWSFDVGAGTPEISTDQNPVVLYDISGTYSVTLIVSNSLGDDTETKVNYIIVVDNPPPAGYCDLINIQHNSITNIDEIVINGISNATGMGESGYVYYYDFETFNFTPGQTYYVLLYPGWSRTRYFWRIWIDLNGNGDFEDADELLFVANNKKGDVSGTMTIPVTASATDITRMRISMKKEAAQSGPCEDGFEGEVEDYNVQFNTGAKSTLINSSGDENLVVDLYPNPVKGNSINLIMNSDIPVTIQVFNKIGVVVDSFNTNSDKTILNISNYPAGLYFVRINSGSESTTRKFIKL